MDIEALLKEKDLKVTPQRKAILTVLAANHTAMNVQELFQEVIKILPGINFSTIYRNLDTMLARGLLCRISRETGGDLYEVRWEEGHHHHVICKGCGASIPVKFCPLEAMAAELAGKSFLPTEHSFEVYGLCDRCQEKKGEKEQST
ncbi:zinc uptake regulation protein [Moorella thermoacetica]|uniref:Zinc uptake regulation protein n=1 Tax=Neomoorella thermoacetica TaxID=1525 RepID=A0A1J5N3C0_NEOTH|nr:zinc uptake regulation protein [Moorella thermoacetica]